MLGDTTEKTKNPLKKAMRRRNAKQVTFNAPNTYVEPSDYEYSSDEDMEDEGSLVNGENHSEEANSNIADEAEDEITTVAPLSVKQSKRDASPEKEVVKEISDEDRRKTIDKPRTSDEIFDRECTFFFHVNLLYILI